MKEESSNKVILLGESGVGKSSLVKAIYGKFNFNEQTTIGCSFNTYLSKNKKVRLGIWDTVGQERFRSLTNIYFRKSKAAVICFDLTSKKQMETIKYWTEKVNECSNSLPYTYLVGTKM